MRRREEPTNFPRSPMSENPFAQRCLRKMTQCKGKQCHAHAKPQEKKRKEKQRKLRKLRKLGASVELPAEAFFAARPHRSPWPPKCCSSSRVTFRFMPTRTQCNSNTASFGFSFTSPSRKNGAETFARDAMLSHSPTITSFRDALRLIRSRSFADSPRHSPHFPAPSTP